MQSDADEKQQRVCQDVSEGSLDLGPEVDARALEYKLQIVRRYFKDYGSIPSFHNFKDLAHLRQSLTYTDPIDKQIRNKIDVDIRARMRDRLNGVKDA